MTDSGAAEFVARFAEAWANPDPDRLAALAHPEVELVQPMLPVVRGRQAWRHATLRLLALAPDLRGEIDGWSASGEDILIEWRLRGTLAWRPFEWPLVDSIRIEDGLVRRRVAYFDSLPLILEGLKRPTRLIALLRLR